MKGGASLFDMIQALHMNKRMPGAGADLLDHEVNDLGNDLVEKISNWTPSDAGCERYDAIVLALAETVLEEYGWVQHAPAEPPPPCVLCGRSYVDEGDGPVVFHDLSSLNVPKDEREPGGGA